MASQEDCYRKAPGLTYFLYSELEADIQRELEVCEVPDIHIRILLLITAVERRMIERLVFASNDTRKPCPGRSSCVSDKELKRQ